MNTRSSRNSVFSGSRDEVEQLHILTCDLVALLLKSSVAERRHEGGVVAVRCRHLHPVGCVKRLVAGVELHKVFEYLSGS